LIQNKDKML